MGEARIPLFRSPCGCGGIRPGHPRALGNRPSVRTAGSARPTSMTGSGRASHRRSPRSTSRRPPNLSSFTLGLLLQQSVPIAVEPRQPDPFLGSRTLLECPTGITSHQQLRGPYGRPRLNRSDEFVRRSGRAACACPSPAIPRRLPGFETEYLDPRRHHRTTCAGSTHELTPVRGAVDRRTATLSPIAKTSSSVGDQVGKRRPIAQHRSAVLVRTQHRDVNRVVADEPGRQEIWCRDDVALVPDFLEESADGRLHFRHHDISGSQLGRQA